MISPEQDAPADFSPGNFPSSFFHTAKGVLFSPGFFYERMKTEGGLRNPFLFLVCCVLVRTLVVSLFVRDQAIIAFNLINGILMPPVTAGILFLVITRLFKAAGSYEVAFRVNAYAAATALFSWIPLIGLFVQFYRFYLIAIGLSRTFSIRVSRAMLAVVIAVIIYILLLAPVMTQILGGRWPTATP